MSDVTNTRARVFKSEEVLTEIFDRMINGESLNSICKSEHLPTRKTVFDWISKDADVRLRYELAMDLRAELLAEEIIEIADDGSNDTYVTDNGETVNHDVIARSRLRVDARKWIASKLKPKKYGDRISTEVSGPDGGPIETKTTIDTSKLTEEQLRALASIGIK